MTVADCHSAFLMKSKAVLWILDEIQCLSGKLYDLNLGDDEEEGCIDADEAADAITVLNQILDLCCDASEDLKQCRESAEMMRALLGINGLFLTSVSMGLPAHLSLKASEIPADTWLIRNIITELRAVGVEISNFDALEAKRQLSRVWTTTALGDQGELEVFKLLLDEGHGVENIQIKPYLENCRPDFYVDEARLICDSKAYKRIYNIEALRDVVLNYSQLLPSGGEIRLYFPSDTHSSLSESTLNELHNLAEGLEDIKVGILPMKKTHSGLTANLVFLYHYLSSL